MIVRNKTKADTGILTRAANDAVAVFHECFPKTEVKSQIQIVFCNDETEMHQERWRYLGKRDQPETGYDGLFVIPNRKTEDLLMMVVVKDGEVDGVRRLFYEKDHGIDKTVISGMNDEDVEARGLMLMAGARFLKRLLHEYSHACSFEALMVETDWKMLNGLEKNVNHRLHDERIAEYRGVRALYRLICDQAENNLVVSFYLGLFDGYFKALKKEVDDFEKLSKKNREDLEVFLTETAKQMRMSGSMALKLLESELGHKVENQVWPPKLTIAEAWEYMAVDEFEQMMMPSVYWARNLFACSTGAHLDGIVQGTYETIASYAGLEIEDREQAEYMEIARAIEVPFYESIHGEAVNEKNKRIWKIFETLAEQ